MTAENQRVYSLLELKKELKDYSKDLNRKIKESNCPTATKNLYIEINTTLNTLICKIEDLISKEISIESVEYIPSEIKTSITNKLKVEYDLETINGTRQALKHLNAYVDRIEKECLIIRLEENDISKLNKIAASKMMTGKELVHDFIKDLIGDNVPQEKKTIMNEWLISESDKRSDFSLSKFRDELAERIQYRKDRLSSVYDTDDWFNHYEIERNVEKTLEIRKPLFKYDLSSEEVTTVIDDELNRQYINYGKEKENEIHRRIL